MWQVITIIAVLSGIIMTPTVAAMDAVGGAQCARGWGDYMQGIIMRCEYGAGGGGGHDWVETICHTSL